jgi:hypothetical protein
MVGNNPVRLLMQIATHVLAARVAEARGDLPAAIEHLRLAVEVQDQLVYDEPPPWPWPVRESLGAALLRAHLPAQAKPSSGATGLNPNNRLATRIGCRTSRAKDEEATIQRDRTQRRCGCRHSRGDM